MTVAKFGLAAIALAAFVGLSGTASQIGIGIETGTAAVAGVTVAATTKRAAKETASAT